MTMMNKKLSTLEAELLIRTSDEDARSSLTHYGAEDIPILEEALRIAKKQDRKTRVTMIERQIKKLRR